MYIDLNENVFDQISSGDIFFEGATDPKKNKEIVLKELDYDPSSRTIKDPRTGKRVRLVISENIPGPAFAKLAADDSPSYKKKDKDMNAYDLLAVGKYSSNAIPSLFIHPSIFNLKRPGRVKSVMMHELGHIFLQSTGSKASTKARTKEDDDKVTPEEGFNPEFVKSHKRASKRFNDKYSTDPDAIKGREDREHNNALWRSKVGEGKDYQTDHYGPREYEADMYSQEEEDAMAMKKGRPRPKGRKAGVLLGVREINKKMRKSMNQAIKGGKVKDPIVRKTVDDLKRNPLFGGDEDTVKGLLQQSYDTAYGGNNGAAKRDYEARRKALATKGIKKDIYQNPSKYSQNDDDKPDMDVKRKRVLDAKKEHDKALGHLRKAKKAESMFDKLNDIGDRLAKKESDKLRKQGYSKDDADKAAADKVMTKYGNHAEHLNNTYDINKGKWDRYRSKK